MGRHRLPGIVLIVAVAVRVLVLLGQRPGEIYWYDSYEYIGFGLHPHPVRDLHPGGYGFFLWLLKPFHSVVLVIALQHMMGLALGVLGYAVLRRRAVPAWGAVLAMIPAFFDVEIVHLEHAVLSDTLFMLLAIGAIIVLLWNPRVSWRAASMAGLMLGVAALVRAIALPVLGLVLVWMAARRVGWRPLAAAALVAALPVVSYAVWYHSVYGQYKLAGGDGAALWARTRTFANCAKVNPPAAEARLCPAGAQADASSEYYWLGEINRPPGRQRNEALGRSFAMRAIKAQPLDYVRAVGADIARAFAYPAVSYPKRLPPVYYWYTPDTEPLRSDAPSRAVIHAYDPSVNDVHTVKPFSGLLTRYRLHIPGPALAIVLLLGGWGVIVRRGRERGARLTVLLPWGTAISLLVLPIMLLGFDHRYVVPVVPVACIAAALGFARPLDSETPGALQP
ncbi:MAG: hypothetical protein NVSMB57_04790 [Actinomycetota bacterium]